MDQFLTLREFLELKDPTYKDYPREYHTVNMGGDAWVKFYDVAKASWEKYGDNPPVGAKVRTRVWDTGRRWGFSGVLTGVYEQDERFFAVVREDRDTHGSTSIYLRCLWWAEFTIVEEEGK